ncbi:MAG TPA: maleylpyruvate isomerase family mycothiol-dependent enzyme [Nocardioidaceae bacterium]|nr:maleylpyruvate isomerase family mycothiol-dependent enzyme [Nocardioidaceae bacterium]
MDREQSWQVIERERRSLADLLETLTPDEWELPSLCEGWRIRDVAAHVVLASRPVSPRDILVEVVRSGGRFHKLNHDMAVRHADRGTDLVAELREIVASRRLPVVTNYRNIVFDVLVHGQDIAVPVGRERAMPVDAAVAGAERVWTMGWPFWARRRFRAVRLVATDAEWTAGAGEVVEGPIAALLLLLTGRSVALDRLSGPGLSRVR